MKFKDISIYFKSSCCNSTDSRVSSLGETLPDQQTHLIDFSKYKHLPLHEICVTFKPKYRQEFDALTLHNKFRTYIEKLIKKTFKYKPIYVFYPEFSATGKLHYHGIIYYDNANDYWTSEYKRLIDNKWGNTLGKQIFNFDNYFKYMTKDKDKDIGLLQPFGTKKTQVPI